MSGGWYKHNSPNADVHVARVSCIGLIMQYMVDREVNQGWRCFATVGLVILYAFVVGSGCASSGSIGDFDSLTELQLAVADIFPRCTLVEGVEAIETALAACASESAVRDTTVNAVEDLLRRASSDHVDVGERLGRDSLRLVGKTPIADLVPNYYRDPDKRDRSRMPDIVYSGAPIVSFLDRPDIPNAGLLGRHIALWPSHGWYYEPALDRWEWQRARLFQTVEDKFPLSFVLKYLVPMLENAGAEVYLPRERDTQRNMVVVDNGGSSGGSRYEESFRQTEAVTATPGFAHTDEPLVEGQNPFLEGTIRVLPPAEAGLATISWIPEIPAPGDYGVFLSYASQDESCPSARYDIHHAGGTTHLSVDQSRGGGTWIYAGTYQFDAGLDAALGSVTLSNRSADDCLLTADAVRFGGGVGNVKRGEATSGRPRYLEGARYHLQYAGAPDTLVFDLSLEIEDYRDDYRSRGEWVNWLRGAPFGPNKDLNARGLGIPVDLSLAFHTDAGVTSADSSIGTLLIYSSSSLDSARAFPDGMSRMANRDFADILQTQIVEDIRRQYDPAWRRRALWDRDYSEAVRPNVPSALLELLSHQNFYDMQFGLNPQFQRDVARSIYKAMLRFLATQYDTQYVVQPLPVRGFSVTLGSESVQLAWAAQIDSLEATAAPGWYLVQQRINGGAWDVGQRADNSSLELGVDSVGAVYEYRVFAVNEGGRSLPSEVLSAGRSARMSAPTIRVVNGFDRIAAPAWFRADSLGGFAHWLDEGVPDGADISYTGPQFDFDAHSPWRDDDEPGFGASFAAWETQAIAGNTHDFSAVHGQSILAAGYSFDSASDEAILEFGADLDGYPVVDLLLGEEKRTPRPRLDGFDFEAIPTVLQQKLHGYQERGGALFVSGANVASDLDRVGPDSAFATDVLRIQFRADLASASGEVYGIRNAANVDAPDVTFSTELNEERYAVEGADAIEPVGEAARILRYRDSNMTAAVAQAATADAPASIVIGFPFESIIDDESRNELMRVVLEFLFRRAPDTTP